MLGNREKRTDMLKHEGKGDCVNAKLEGGRRFSLLDNESKRRRCNMDKGGTGRRTEDEIREKGSIK